jgi:hypothetical protein
LAKIGIDEGVFNALLEDAVEETGGNLVGGPFVKRVLGNPLVRRGERYGNRVGGPTNGHAEEGETGIQTEAEVEAAAATAAAAVAFRLCLVAEDTPGGGGERGEFVSPRTEEMRRKEREGRMPMPLPFQ